MTKLTIEPLIALNVVNDFFSLHAAKVPSRSVECRRAAFIVAKNLMSRCATMVAPNRSDLIIQAISDGYISLPAGYKKYFNRGKLESLKYQLWKSSK